MRTQHSEPLAGVLPEPERPALCFGPQGGQPGQLYSGDGKGGPQGVQQEDPSQGDAGIKNSGQRGGEEHGDGLDALAPTGAPGQGIGRGQQGRDGLDAGGMKCAAHTAQRGHRQDRGHRKRSGKGGGRQHQGHQPDGPVRDYHDPAPVEAVGKGSGEEGQDSLWDQRRHGGQGEDRGGAGQVGQVPNEGVLRNHAAEDGQGLPCPEEGEFLLPVWYHSVPFLSQPR